MLFVLAGGFAEIFSLMEESWRWEMEGRLDRSEGGGIQYVHTGGFGGADGSLAVDT